MTAEELFSLGLNRESVLAILARLNEEEEEKEAREEEKEEQIRKLREELASKEEEIGEAVRAEKSAAEAREEELKKEHEEALGRVKAERLAEHRSELIGKAASEAGFLSDLARRGAVREMEEGEEEPEAYLARLRGEEPGLFSPDKGGAPVFTVPAEEEGEDVPDVRPPFVYLRKPVNA